MFNKCVSEAVIKLLVEVFWDGGDLFLLCGFLAKGCAKWFLKRKRACSFVVNVWFGIVPVGF